MTLFSERYGYTKPSDVIIREKMTPEIINAICSCYDDFKSSIIGYDEYTRLEEYLWRYFLENRANDFWSAGGGHYIVATQFVLDKSNPWYRKLDIIEESLNYFMIKRYYNWAKILSEKFNKEFIRLNFGYRIIDNKIVEVTSEEEIIAIEQALKSRNNSVKLHLNKALELLSLRPEGDYRNSIKESISAVEAFNRTITGGSDFNLKKMENKGIVLPSVLKKAFDTLYGYTCDPEIGVRHSLMDVDSDYIPNSEEAIFMLVSCSAFINYLEKKKSN